MPWPNTNVASTARRAEAAAAQPWHRRKAVRRFAVLALVLLAVGAAVQHAGPVWERVRLLYWQRQCLAYGASADQAVYELTVAAPGAGEGRAANPILRV